MRLPPDYRSHSSTGSPGFSNASLPHPFDLLHKIQAKTLAWQPIPDALQVQAVAEWGNDGLVEIVVVSGFYQMFAAINQGFDIQPPGQPAAPLKA
jgi:4-carboxymuconolactone decarboxylase